MVSKKNKRSLTIRSKLIIILLAATVLPLVVLVATSYIQITDLGTTLSDMAVSDSTKALNDSAVENIERLSTDTANQVAQFLYNRDADIQVVASLPLTEEAFRNFAESKTSLLVEKGNWVLSDGGTEWICTDEATAPGVGGHFHQRRKQRPGRLPLPLA